MAAIAPAQQPSCATPRTTPREVIDACLHHRRPDGLFCDVPDDPGSFAEANLAQLLAYASFTAVTDGWLPVEYPDTAGSLRLRLRRRWAGFHRR